MEILPIHNQITGLVLSWCPKILCLCPVPQVQGIVCRTHRPPLYLHHHPPSLHPIIQQDAVSLWGRRLSFFIFCPLSILHFPWFSAHERSQRSNEAGGGAQGVFRVVVHCVLLLPVDSVGPWALPVEEAKGRHYRTYNLRPPGSSMLFLIKTMPGRGKKTNFPKLLL